MALRKITQGGVEADEPCEDGKCPTIYETDSGSFVVQGNNAELLFSSEGMALPSHERVVEIPRSVMSDFVQRFAR